MTRGERLGTGTKTHWGEEKHLPQTMNNMDSTTLLLHLVFTNLEQVIIFTRVFLKLGLI
jgi:hypothetical protein